MRNFLAVLILSTFASQSFAAERVVCQSCTNAYQAGMYGAATLYDHRSVTFGNIQFDIGWGIWTDTIQVFLPALNTTFLVNLDAVPLNVFFQRLPGIPDASLTLVSSVDMRGQNGQWDGNVPNSVLRSYSMQIDGVGNGSVTGSGGSSSGGGLGGSNGGGAAGGGGVGSGAFGFGGGGYTPITGICEGDGTFCEYSG